MHGEEVPGGEVEAPVNLLVLNAHLCANQTKIRSVSLVNICRSRHKNRSQGQILALAFR